jgi:hypothetical protein
VSILSSETSGRYENNILNDVFLVMSFPQMTLLLYVLINELPNDVLLMEPTIDFKNDFARARAAEATPALVGAPNSSSVSSMLDTEALLEPPICLRILDTNPASLSTEDPKIILYTDDTPSSRHSFEQYGKSFLI